MPVRESWSVEANAHLAPVHIDLDGPEGNAWNLMAHMRKRALLMGYSKEKIDAVRVEMMQKDYVHLIAVMEKEFPGAFEFSTKNKRLIEALIEAGVENA